MSEIQQTPSDINTIYLKKIKYVPSKKTDGKYIVLQEYNDEECEAWLYFLRLSGNEDALRKLHDQLESIDWYVMEGGSTFDIDLEHPISATTAKEMTKIELNSYSFHRKFDGKLKHIDFGFRRKDSNKTKMCKVCDAIGYGQIEKFIDDEDLDVEDLVDCDDDCPGCSDCERSAGYSPSDSDSQSPSNSDSDSDSDSNSTSSADDAYKTLAKNKKLPASFAKIRKR